MIKPNNTVASEKLLSFIEEEALSFVKEIDLDSTSEFQVNFEEVLIWYTEAEKIIRILANILPAPMDQPINQLRYAGHHVLKAAKKRDQTRRNCMGDPNLIEAYKHCKRAYYDSLDLYKFHMVEIFKSKACLLSGPNAKVKDEAKDLREKLLAHIDRITQARFKCNSRIAYYAEISKNLKDGLPIIHELNQRLLDAGVTDNLFAEKSMLQERIAELEGQNADLKITNDEILVEAVAAHNFKVYVIAMLALIVTGVGMVYQGYFTQKNITSKVESSVELQQINTSPEPATTDKM